MLQEKKRGRTNRKYQLLRHGVNGKEESEGYVRSNRKISMT